jgi:hypothetical protein
MFPVFTRLEMRGHPGDLDRFGAPNELAALGDDDPSPVCGMGSGALGEQWIGSDRPAAFTGRWHPVLWRRRVSAFIPASTRLPVGGDGRRRPRTGDAP